METTISPAASAGVATLPPELAALTLEAWREHAIDLRRADHCQPPEAAAALVAVWPPSVDALTMRDPATGVRAHIIYRVDAPHAAVRRELARVLAEA